jgi:nitrogenase molybdenum-iron protein alpha chain
MSAEYENDGAFNEQLIEEVLAAYPEKFAKRRRKHLTVAKAAGEEEAAAEDGKVASECEVKSNIKSTTNSPTISALLRVGRTRPIK